MSSRCPRSVLCHAWCIDAPNDFTPTVSQSLKRPTQPSAEAVQSGLKQSLNTPNPNPKSETFRNPKVCRRASCHSKHCSGAPEAGSSTNPRSNPEAFIRLPPAMREGKNKCTKSGSPQSNASRETLCERASRSPLRGVDSDSVGRVSRATGLQRSGLSSQPLCFRV